MVSSSRVRLRSSTSPSRASLARSWFSAYCCSRALFLFDFECGKIVVEFIEEAGDVDLLRAETLTGGGNDGAVEAEALGGLNAGGGAGDAEAELVVGNERSFIDAGGGVEHARRVGGVDLERGVVGGDERPRAAFEEMRGDGNGERGAFFRIGGRAEFVEKDERACIGKAREAIEIDDVRGESGELGLDGLGVADVGEECSEDGEAG